MIGSLVLLQVTAAAPVTGSPAESCGQAPRGEILVCGPRTGESPYRLPKLTDKYDGKRIRLETNAIPGVHTRAHADSKTMRDGRVSNRLMVTYSLPF